MSSHELNTSKFSFVLRTHENSDVFNTLDEIYSYSPQKSKYPLSFSLTLDYPRIDIANFIPSFPDTFRFSLSPPK